MQEGEDGGAHLEEKRRLGPAVKSLTKGAKTGSERTGEQEDSEDSSRNDSR